MAGEERGLTFEVEVATVEEFLRLLREWEESEASLTGPRGAVRRAVFVAQQLDRRDSGYGYASVRRYVVATFAYERDLVSYRRTTSSAVELPDVASRAAEQQQQAYEETRTEIERALESMGLNLLVYEGSLRHPAMTSENRGCERP